MRTSTTITGVIALGTIAALSGCSSEGDAAPSTEPPTSAPASASASDASQPSGDPSAGDPERFAVDGGGYMFTLPDGGVCSVDSELNDKVGSDFACLLTLEEPMRTEDGEATTGLEYRDTMFVPSAALTDPDLQKEFTEADAEPLEAGSRITAGDYQVMAETQDEILIENDVIGGSFFIAAQQPTRFWMPRPDWAPEPNFPPID